MRSPVLYLFAALILTFPFAAQAQSAATPAPAKSKKSAKTQATTEAKPAPDTPAHDYSQEAFVIEQYRSIYRFENDGTGRKETIARVRVQSEAGVQQWGQIQFGYNSANERVEIVYVRVIQKDGSVVKAGDDAVQDLSAPSSSRLRFIPITGRSTLPCPACGPAKLWNMTLQP